MKHEPRCERVKSYGFTLDLFAKKWYDLPVVVELQQIQRARRLKMKKSMFILLVSMLLAISLLALAHSQDLADVGKVIDAKIVFALAEGSDNFCPNLMLGDEKLVKQHIQSIVSEDGKLNDGWLASISRQSMMLNPDARSIIGLSSKEGKGRFEIHYDSGINRIISISRDGKITCENGSELLKK